MTKDEVVAKLKKIVSDRLDVEEDQVSPDKTFVEDLGADSLSLWELKRNLTSRYLTKMPKSSHQ